MAKFKKTAGKTANRGGGNAQDQADRLSRTLTESAQQIWLAGVGAFGRAQAEGAKLFEALVKEGLSLEKTARGFAGGRADFVRDAVENHVGQARERATDTWDRLGVLQAFGQVLDGFVRDQTEIGSRYSFRLKIDPAGVVMEFGDHR